MSNSHFEEVEYRVGGKDQRSFIPHNDRSIEIIQTWSAGGFFLIKNQIYPIEPGAVYMINAMETHHSNPSDATKYVRSKIIFSFGLLETIKTLFPLQSDFFESFLTLGSKYFYFAANDSNVMRIDSLFKTAADRFHANHAFREVKLSICVFEIITALLSETSSEHTNKSKPLKILFAIMDYINLHMENGESISVDNMCRELSISKSYASHLFKQSTGFSIIEYVSNLRITEAKKLLMNTSMKIIEIATLLHFKDSNTFCKTFKKNMNCSPKEYRRLKNDDSNP